MTGKSLFLRRESRAKNGKDIKRTIPGSLKVNLALFISFLFVSTLSFAQTGPAGISSGLQVWLDASDLDGNGSVEGLSEAGLTGDSVDVWVNKAAASGDDFTLASGFVRPTYLATDALFNNRAAVDFDTNTVLEYNNPTTLTGDHTIFILFYQENTTPFGTGLFASGGEANTRFEISMNGGATAFDYVTQGGTASVGTVTTAQSAATLYTVTRSGSNIVCYENASQSGSGSSANGNQIDRFILNADRGKNDVNDCLIAEVIIYNRALTIDEIARIENYLDCKYDANIATTSPGGVNPCDMSLWLKADAGTGAVATGNQVSTWVDQGSHGFDASVDGSGSPDFNEKDNNFNPSLSFNASNNDGLRIPLSNLDGLMLESSSYNIYVVAAGDTTATNPGVVFADNKCAETSGYRVGFDAAAANEWSFLAGRITNASTQSSYEDSAYIEIDNSTSEYSMLALDRAGITHSLATNETSSIQQDVVSNAYTIHFETPAIDVPDSTERWIGRQATCGGASPFQGKVSELMIVKAGVTSLEDQKIRSYLGLKYGLTNSDAYLMASGDTLWDYSAYNNNVAGIARDDSSSLHQRVSKSQNRTGIVTVATTGDFTIANNNVLRTDLSNESALVWGNDNVSAATPWDTTGAPLGYALLGTRWRVKETGAMGTIHLQVDVDDPENDIPTFFGDLYLVRGTDLSAVVPMPMSGTGSFWTTTVNFDDGDFFSFAVRNNVDVEFAVDSAASTNESLANNFPNIRIEGVVNTGNVSFIVDTASIAGGTAYGSGIDYTFVSDTVVLGAGDYDSTHVLAAPVLNDDVLVEGDETIIFSINPEVGVFINDVSGTAPTIDSLFVYTITDDDSYVLAIADAPDTVENGGPISFVVSLEDSVINTTPGGIIITMDFDDGSATISEDFTVSTTTVVIPVDSNSVTVTVPIVNDYHIEPMESVIAKIVSVSNGNVSIGMDSVDVVNITDDDYSNFTVSIGSPVNGAEGGQQMEFTIALDSGAYNYYGPGVNITGDISWAGTANITTPVDYYPTYSFTIPYDTNSVVIPVAIEDDAIAEAPETVIPTISNIQINGVSTGNGNYLDSTSTANILDDETPGLQIRIDTLQSGAENGADVGFVVSLVGGVVNASGDTITGDINYSGAAADGSDFTGVAEFGILLGDSTDTIYISVLDDSDLEGPEVITATILNQSIGNILVNSADGYIHDDEADALTVSITAQGNVTEGSGVVMMYFDIELDGGVTNITSSAISGNLTFSGTATNPADFAGGVGSFDILVDSTSTTIPVLVANDDFVELTESVTLKISDLTLGSANPLADSATIYITDDDSASLTLSLSYAAPTATEGVSNANFVVTMDNGKINQTGSDITGSFSYGGSALPVDDYNQVLSFDIPNGASSVVETMTVEDDLNIELVDTLVVTIHSPNIGAPNLSSDTDTVFIYDDDINSFSVSIGAPILPSVDEDSQDSLIFPITMNTGINNTGFDIVGDVAYIGSATGGDDFLVIPNFTISNGSDSTVLKVPVLDDSFFEPIETVEPLISNLTISGQVMGNIATATSSGDILDDEAANLSLSIDTLIHGDENNATLIPMFVVSLDSNIVNNSGSIITGSVQYTGIAESGQDYLGTNPVFNIPDGASSDTIWATIVDDDAAEYTEDVIAGLLSTNIGVINPASDTAVAIIADNDSLGLTISIGNPVDGLEGSSGASFTVSLDNGKTNGFHEPISVDVTFTGTAISGTDYLGPAIIEIPEDVNSHDQPINVLNDLKIELTETIIAEISSPNFGAISVDSVDTANINDDDYNIASISITKTSDGLEGGAPLGYDGGFVVTLNGGLRNETGSPITGDMQIGGDAIPNADYDSIAPTFSIPNDTNLMSIPLTVIDDALEEQTETVSITLLNTTVGVISALNSATADIVDDDTDSDNDGLNDALDPNDGNIDTDGDGIYDGCDVDVDGDGIPDNGTDFDGDGINDASDADYDGDGIIDNGPDINGDGVNDVAWDPTDSDGDYLPDHVDPNDNNPDTDGDGIPDGADVDINGDGIPDNGTDTDNDGIHDVADADDNPTDEITDVGNLDDDQDGIDNDWDPIHDGSGGEQINFIVSPNGDGKNDTFFIKGVQFFEFHELIIFNRWGSPVYKSTQYENDWDGQVNQGVGIGGDKLPEGTYYYTLDFGNGQGLMRGYIELRK